MAATPVAGLTHDLVLSRGAPGSETHQGIMVAGGLKHYSSQPYTPFAPVAREGEATNRDLALPAVWELQQDWSGGVGKFNERKTEDNGYALSRANSLPPTSAYYNSKTGTTLFTGLAGCIMPAPALTGVGSDADVKQFYEFKSKYGYIDSANPGKVFVFDADGLNPDEVNDVTGAGLSVGATQVYTDGSTLYVCQGASNPVRISTATPTNGAMAWANYQVGSPLANVNADFVCVRDDGALAYVAGATLTPGTGVAGTQSYSATTVGWTGTTATSMVFFKGALWIGKPEGLYSWYEGKIDKRVDVGENYSTNNFTKMAVHNSLLYYNIRNQLFFTDGQNYTQIFPNDAGGFANIACLFPTSGPLLIGGKLLVFADGQTPAYFPGTMADDSSIGTITWSNPANVAALDNTYATAALTGTTQVSHYLKCTNFAITLPTSATPIGVRVKIHTEFGYFNTFTARLVIGGVISGDIETVTWNSKIRMLPQSGDWVFWVGGKADLWGNDGLTRANVVASNFGVVISATGLASTARIDAVELAVFYTRLDNSPEQLYEYWGQDAPGLNPLWSDDDGTHPVLAAGATSLFDATGNRIYFCCNDAYYTNKLRYLSMTPRYVPASFTTEAIYTSYIDLTEFSAGFRTVEKWWYKLEMNVRDPIATTFAKVQYCIDQGEWLWIEDEVGNPETFTLSARIVGGYFPLDAEGVFCQLRVHMYTTDATNVAKITHITLRGLTQPKVRYQFAFPADCSDTVPNLTPVGESGEAVRTFIRAAAAQGYPCRFQDPWGAWHLTKFREPAPLDVIAGAEKPRGNARQRIYAAVQCVLVEVDELDANGDLAAWSVG